MQDCFRQYPEIYGSELDEDDDVSATESNIEPSSHEESAPSAGSKTPNEKSSVPIDTEKVTEESPAPTKSSSYGLKDNDLPNENEKSEARSQNSANTDAITKEVQDHQSQSAS